MRAQSSLAERMRSIRTRFGYTQGDMARAIGSKLRSWQEWETGNRMPSAQALAGLARLGVNVNWILIGEEPELVADMGNTPDPTLGFEHDLLEDILLVMHEYQTRKGVRWQPAQEAKLVAALYNYMIQPRSLSDEDRQRTLDLVRTLMEGMNVEP